MKLWSGLTAAFSLMAAPAFAVQGPPPGRALPTIDALANEAGRAHLFALQRSEALKVDNRMHLSVHELYGVPTFVFAARPAGQSVKARPELAGAGPIEAMARTHLSGLASLYRMTPADVAGLELREVHDTGQGALIARFGQRIGGVEVFRDELKVAMSRTGELVSISGSVAGDAALAPAPVFKLAAHEALSLGLDDLHGADLSLGDLVDLGAREGGFHAYGLSPGSRLAQTLSFASPARAKQVMFHHADGYEPAWYVELDAGPRTATTAEMYAYVISAQTGEILFRNNLTMSDGFSYRVWADTTTDSLHTPLNGPQGKVGDPHPTGVPDGYAAPFIAPSLLTLAHGPINNTDPWLDPSATVTTGNNVEAYADITGPDGYNTGDVRADTTSANTFDRVYDLTKAPDTSDDQRKAAVTQLFYNINYWHDWYYNAGFTEAAGNAQDKNYGRGGVEGDSIRGEAQDSSGTDNANMSTPADGGRPRMQMYVWTGIPLSKMTISAPADLAGDLDNGDALFGASVYDVSGDLVAGVYGNNALDGCSPFTNAAAIAGKIVYVDRGNCNFTVKVKNGQVAGAKAVLIGNNADGRLRMAGTDSSITIGAMIILKVDADKVRAKLNANTTVSVRMRHGVAVNTDGDIDNQVSGHEWGHYISNRLIGNANGLSTNMSRGMGEGWADTHAMLMTVAAADKAKAGNDHWQGVYALAQYVSTGGENEGYYFGIRRMPYSRDMTKNSLTFKDIAEGVALNTNGGATPISFGADGVGNSEVHSTGEVWATMLWECYSALLDDGRFTFDQARDRWRNYLVAAYKLTPVSPTFLDARDAILAAALAQDPADYALFVSAFAKRGAGTRAVSPDRFSSDNTGAVDDFTAGQDVQLISATLDDSVTPLCGGNGVLGNGETGKLTLTIRNLGATALSGTTVAVSSTNPKLTFPGGNTATFGSIGALATGAVSLNASVSGATGVQQFPISIVLHNGVLASDLSTTVSIKGNYTAVANQADSDDIEAPTTTWTTAHNPTPGLDTTVPWRISADAANNHVWAAPQPGVSSDQWLISPPIQASLTQGLKLTFKQRYSFTVVVQDPNTFYMGGGVLEASIDGSTWSDIGANAGLGYQTTALYAGLNNPLGGNTALAGKSPNYPAFQPATVDLGLLYAGKTVQFRFRVGASDYPTSALGWEIDDVQVSGAVVPPFPALVPQGSTCNHAPVASAGPDQTVNDGTTVTLDASGTTDPDGDSLSYQWVQTSGAPVALASSTTPHATFSAPRVRHDTPYTFAVLVNDGTLTASDSVTVTVQSTNHAPVAVIAPITSAAVDSKVTLDGSGSTDADNDTLSYRWTQTAGPHVALTGDLTAKPTFTMVSGTITLQLVASDGFTDSAPATVTIASTAAPGGCTSTGAQTAWMLLPLALLALGRRRKLA